MCKNAAVKSPLICLMLALAAMPAFAAERLTFTNSDPKVLSLLAAEGVAGATQVDAEGRALAQLELDGGLAAIYAQDERELRANLYLDGGKDVYRFQGLAECAGLLEVDFAGTALETQIRSSALDVRGRYLTQAVATSALPTGRELLAVRGGVRHQVEVAWTGGVDNGGEALTFTRTFDVAVGCDQLVQLSVGGRANASLGEALDDAAGDLFQGSPATLPRREAGDRLLGQESAAGEALPLVEPGQICSSDDFNDNNLDGWTFSLIGDADQGGAVAAGGAVNLTSDGTAFYHAPDNGGFLHRSVSGDFRAQIKLLGFPVNAGGGFKKTSLTVRSGLGPDDPRVTIQFIPNHPTYNTTAIQFDYRDAAGVERELASTALNVPIPAYLMLERRGTVFSAYYSTDGSSWIRQLGGAGNAVSINMPGTLQLGMMNASYHATVTLTSQFDDFKVCSPNVVSLPPIPAGDLCLPGTPIDILYLLDSTGSMTFPFAGGGVSKLDAARQAIAEMNDLIESSLPGSRAALVTFQGGFTPAYNLNNAVRVLSHLTTDFDAVDAAAASIDVAAINPDATTPIAIALNRTYDIFQNEADPDHIPVVIFIGDGWANIDKGGHGPSYYRFEEMQAISIGAYLPPGQVAWLGNFNGPLGTYDGQVLADAMIETLRLKEDIPHFMMFTLGVHSNATFRPDLLGFMALYTGAEFYDVASAADLVGVLVGIYNGLDCGAQIGDRVWDDADGDGVQDPGEAGLEGVTVELVDGDGNVADTQVTGANGDYLFEHVVPGTYTVRVVTSTLPEGWGTQTFDFDGLGTPDAATVTVGEDQIFLDADFGYKRFSGAIGDRVWNDVNGDGVQDGGEAGLAGVTVELRDASDAVIATQVTDANGIYNFTGLGPGNYTVTVVPAGLGSSNIPTFDRDGVATPHAAAVTLTDGQVVTDADFGYRACAGSISDRVWFDQNGNGNQDPGEPGIGGVTVELVDGSNAVIATRVTDANGLYSFGSLDAGSYTVRIDTSTLPAGSSPSSDPDGTATPNQATVVLGCNQNVGTIDFGYRYEGSIGDRVWKDSNGDGVQDGGEPGLSGVTVELRDSSNVVVATKVTDGNGNYSFTGLGPGTYTVTVVPAGLGATSIPTFDRDGIASPNVATVVLAANQAVTDADFGYRGCDGSVGNRVWLDADADGVQDPGENGIAGVTVQLLDGSNAVIATTVTDAGGNYSFGGLAAGSYTVKVFPRTLPNGAQPSFDLDGVATAHQATFKLACDQDREDVDFGYSNSGSIGDRVWKDTDGDGAQDAGETGLTGVTLQLRDSSNNLVASTVTGANGIYSFTGLAAGTYTVTVVPAGLGANTTPTFDLDGVATPHVASVALTAGQTRTDVDFGYKACAGSIGDKVWDDKNGNGVKDSGEVGIANITLQLVDASNVVIDTKVTDASGTYTFSNVGPGTYTVRVVASSLPAGATPTFDLDGLASLNQAVVTLSCGQVKTDVDFGYKFCLGSIGDRVWDDKNGNGSQNSGEVGIGGVTVELLNASNAVIATKVTDSSGAYTFNNLVAGTYSVRIVASTLPAGYVQTFDKDGVATPHIATLTLTCNQNKTDIDFGYKPCLGSIGDKIWDDKDGDGVQDSGETGIGGVQLQLLNSSNAVIATTTTNSSGVYGFSGLAAGTYTVKVLSGTVPAGFTPSYDLDGVATAHQATVTLSCNQTKTDVDFGYKSCKGSIGDKIWDDKNGNGTQNSGEPGIAGVTVELVNASNVVVATTTTNSSGVYTFNNVDSGTWSVRVVASTLPAGYTQTYDKDGVATPHVATFTLSCNQTKTDIDFGYKGCGGSIGDRVWDDKDGDGVQDSGETGISGVTVQLYNSSNALIATATTNSTGKYTFSNLGSGTYTVKVVASTVGDSVLPTFDLDGTGTPNQATVTLSCGQVKTDVDFGYRFCNGWLGDRVWEDEDGDGNQDGEEKGLEGVQLQLVDSANVVVATTTTGDDGWYGFSNVTPGTYKVKVVTSTLPEGIDTATHDLDGLGSLHQATVTISCNGKNEHVDFGYRNPSSGGGWCPRTIGYWKNHTSEWPARNLKLGTVTYNMTQLIAFLNYSGSDASNLLAKQLVATKLNLLMGSDTWINSIVKDADDFLEAYPPGSNPQGAKRDWALKLKDDLDKYNNDPNCH